MAITIAELLAEPQLGLSLIAGADGLGNRIMWAHTSDLPRLWEWVTGGEIMMTNGMSIPPDAAGQVELAHALVDAGASGLAIGEKMHAPQLQPEFLDACDRLPLPLINVPYPLPFIAIARSVAESSLLEESRRLRQTARIYDLLRLADTSDNQWKNLLRGVAAELDSRLYVVDRRSPGGSGRCGCKAVPMALVGRWPAHADDGHPDARQCGAACFTRVGSPPGSRRAAACRHGSGPRTVPHGPDAGKPAAPGGGISDPGH